MEKKTKLRNKNKILKELREKSIETLEDIAVFSKSITKKTIANRLLKLYYKRKKPFTIEYVKGSSYEFPCFNIRPFIIEAFSLNHAANILIQTEIKPSYKHGFKQCKEYIIGKFDMEIRDFYLETELWNKIFHNESVKDCKHFIVSYQGFNIENNNINPKHIMLAKYQLIQCANCGKILGIVKPKKPKRKFRVH